MSGKQLTPTLWREALSECSEQWKNLSPAEKKEYESQAATEQSLRDAAALEPFPAKQQPTSQGAAASQLCKNALNTVGKQRAMASYVQYKAASDWAEYDAGVFCPEGAIALDSIDMDTTAKEIQDQWEVFAKPASLSDIPDEWKLKDVTAPLHHSTCHQNHGGLCKSVPLLGLVTKFVHAMADAVASGDLALWILLHPAVGGCYTLTHCGYIDSL